MTANRRPYNAVTALLATFSIIFLALIGCASTPSPPPTSDTTETITPSPTDTAESTAETEEPNPPETAASPQPTAEPSSANTGQTTDTDTIPGRIAFIGSNGQLGTVNPNGEEMRFLTNSGIYQFPAWSPTTDQIAIIGSNSEGTGVFVTDDSDSNSLLPLYSQTSPIYLYWSPNGDNVSFIAQHPEGLALHLAPADGAADTTILSTGQPLYWQWLPDNQQAVTHVGGEELAYVDVEGNIDALGFGQGGIFQAPALSPSGQFFAFSQGEDVNNLSIVVREREANEPLYEQPHSGTLAMGWSPTADQLAYISPAENRPSFFGPLRLFDAENGQSDVIVSSNVLMFFWSPDGRYIAYITLRDSDAFQAQANKMRSSKPALQDAERPVFTLFVHDVENNASLPLYSFEPTLLFITQFLPFFDQYAYSHRIWSPDSRHLVLPVRTNDEVSEIIILSLDQREPTVIANGVSAFWSHR